MRVLVASSPPATEEIGAISQRLRVVAFKRKIPSLYFIFLNLGQNYFIKSAPVLHRPRQEQPARHPLLLAGR
jgi:hypothetical protein